MPLEVLAQHGRARTEMMEVVVVVFHRVDDPARGLANGGVVGHRHLACTADGDRLQVLRSHDCAQSRATGDLVQIIHDERKANPVLAGDACLGDADEPIGVGLTNGVLDFSGFLAPQVPGISEFDPIVHNPQIDRLCRASMDDDRVPAGVTQLGTPEAACLRFAEGSGQRRLGANGMATGAGEWQSGQNPAGEHQDVVGTEWVGVFWHLAQQVMRDQRTPTKARTVSSTVPPVPSAGLIAGWNCFSSRLTQPARSPSPAR